MSKDGTTWFNLFVVMRQWNMKRSAPKVSRLMGELYFQWEAQPSAGRMMPLQRAGEGGAAPFTTQHVKWSITGRYSYVRSGGAGSAQPASVGRFGGADAAHCSAHCLVVIATPISALTSA